MKKIYVGCALTHAPEKYRQMVFRLRELLRVAGLEVVEFGWQNGPRPDINVYEFDMKAVGMSDVLVALCDYPSIGLGMEFERRAKLFDRGIPLNILAFASKRGKTISKIIPDFLEFHRLPRLIYYETPEEIVRKVAAYCRRLKAKRYQRAPRLGAAEIRLWN